MNGGTRLKGRGSIFPVDSCPLRYGHSLISLGKSVNDRRPFLPLRLRNQAQLYDGHSTARDKFEGGIADDVARLSLRDRREKQTGLAHHFGRCP